MSESKWGLSQIAMEFLLLSKQKILISTTWTKFMAEAEICMVLEVGGRAEE